MIIGHFCNWKYLMCVQGEHWKCELVAGVILLVTTFEVFHGILQED